MCLCSFAQKTIREFSIQIVNMFLEHFIHTKKYAYMHGFLLFLVLFFIYLVYAPHDWKGLCVRCCARAYNTQSSAALSLPPAFHPSSAANLLHNHLLSSNLIPPVRYFMSLLLVFKEGGGANQSFQLPFTVKCSLQLQVWDVLLAYLQNITKGLLLRKVFAKHSMNTKASGDTVSTSLKLSTDFKF